MSDSLVSVKSVNKTYQRGGEELVVLDDLSLEVPEGDFLALMGPSGSGKSTLLNLIGGLDTPTTGSVEVDGERLDSLNSKALSQWRSSHVGFIFQFYNLLPVLTAFRNVELPLLVSGFSGKEARSKALEKLAQVELEDWQPHLPGELSGGQRQRVTLARALVNDPAIVWADEPTGNLDSENERLIMDLLIQLNKENNQTFVIVTHSDYVGGRTDRIIQMKDGEVV